MQRTLIILGLIVGLLALASCNKEAPVSVSESQTISPISLAKTTNADAELSSIMDAINSSLASSGKNYRIAMAEYIAVDQMGNTVLQKDVGNKQLSFDFVPFDGRRVWSGAGGSEITWAADQTIDAVPPFGGLTAAQTDAAITRAMQTWEDASCSDLGLSRNNDFGVDIGYIAFLNGLGGSPNIIADVQHCGFRDINFVSGILGVTFTFGFTNGGNWTDINNDGKIDCAFREIYYDPSYSWADDGSSNVDFETVALHESGHGLSQAHFGNLSYKNDGSFKASPRAVMNAYYGGPLRDLMGTDIGGHCSIWAQWPQN